MNKIWTEEKDAQLKEILAEGHLLSTTCWMLEVPPGVLARRMHQLGLDEKLEELNRNMTSCIFKLFKQGWSAEHIVDATGLPFNYIWNIVGKYEKQRSPKPFADPHMISKEIPSSIEKKLNARPEGIALIEKLIEYNRKSLRLMELELDKLKAKK